MDVAVHADAVAEADAAARSEHGDRRRPRSPGVSAMSVILGILSRLWPRLPRRSAPAVLLPRRGLAHRRRCAGRAPGHAAPRRRRDASTSHARAARSRARALAAAHAGSATLVDMGVSAGGRHLWAVEIAAPGPTPPASRPGILVVANLGADQIAGSTLALGIARACSPRPTSRPARQLAACVFYIVPRARRRRHRGGLRPLLAPRRSNLTPFDDDNDGRVDEDPPEDLNGDGVITMMRVQGSARRLRAVRRTTRG